MNPFLQYLMSILRAQNGGRISRQSAHSSNAPGGPMSNSAYTPETTQLLHALLQSYLNPGGGRMGNDTVGGGQVFGGFQRNGQPVGNIGWLSGNSPSAYGQSQMASSLQPNWGAQNWLNQFINDANGSQSNPYNAPPGGGGMFGEQAGGDFHGGGEGMMDFLNRGTSLQSMDDAFRGGGGMGGGMGISTNFYV